MNGSADMWMEWGMRLGRASLGMAIAGAVVSALLWRLQPRSAWLHRRAWQAVLLQGILLAPLSLAIPLLEPDREEFTFDRRGRQDDPSRSANEWRLSAQSGETSALQDIGVLDDSSGQAATVVPARFASSLRWTMFTIWFLGWGAICLVAAFGYVTLWLAARRSSPPTEEWRREWRQTLAEFGRERDADRIPLRVHSTMGPLLCRLPAGYAVIVPRGLWRSLTSDERRAVLRHEAAHYCRGDVWRSLAVRALAALHWPNPVGWWSARKLEECAEWACDRRLSELNPADGARLARVLLKIVERRRVPLLVSAAHGAPLCTRIRRLLGQTAEEDSMLKRVSILAALAAVVALGTVRFHLVAREPGSDASANSSAKADGENTEASEALRKRIAAFAGELASEQGEATEAFRKALGTEAGQIAVADRAARAQEEVRSKAAERAIDDYFTQHFDESAAGLALRADQQAYRENFLNSVSQVNEDLAAIGAVLKDIVSRFDADTEAAKMVAKFMESEAGPPMLYVEELRKHIRPTYRNLESRLGEVFARDENGNYTVRPGREVEVEEFLAKNERQSRLLDPLAKELKAWSEDLAANDDFHRKVKQLMSERLFAAFVASQLDGDSTQPVDQFFDRLERATDDTPDGLVFRDEARGELEKGIAKYEQVCDAAASYAPLLSEFADHIRPENELHQRAAKMLKTEVIALRYAEEEGGTPGDAQTVVRTLLSKILTEENGRFRFTADDESDVIGSIEKLNRQFREMRRRGREVDEISKHIIDGELREALVTPAGKIVMVSQIRESLERQSIDGFGIWRDSLFDKTAKGYVPKSDAAPALREVLDDAARVARELEKNDF